MGSFAKPYSKTAVLLFTRTVNDECRAKDFSNTKRFRQNYQVAETFIQHSFGILHKSQLPYFIIDSEHQHGHSFGERLANAISEIFEQQFDNVIVIGNDCPGLKSKDLISAADYLENHACILGPDKRGGLYLIGIKKTLFNRYTFQFLPWESGDLLNAFIDLLANSEYKITGRKNDLNNYSDLHGSLKSYLNIFSFYAKLCSILSAYTKASGSISIPPNRSVNSHFTGRAPPFYFA